MEQLAAQLVGSAYISQGMESIKSRENMFESLLTQRSLPAQGWDDTTIQALMSRLALMDSNNFTNNIGVGEREGRIFSHVISQRHFHLAHGVGRSGDLGEVQPKAAASSLVFVLTNALVRHALRLAGFAGAKDAAVLPLATGMSILLTLRTLLREHEGGIVVWCRCDQKSCIKAIDTAGFKIAVVDGILKGDEVVTNLEAIRKILAGESTPQNPKKLPVVAVITTTSCFAPRAPDNVVEVAKLCAEFNVVHIVNNAYGVQCRKTMATINQAHAKGRVDVTVQSTDKNFMVPVGGCVIASGRDGVVDQICKGYPGRGSASSVIDLFITLLSMGKDGFLSLLEKREQNFAMMRAELTKVMTQVGERLLSTPHNHISMAISLDNTRQTKEGADLTQLGSMLFSRHCTGARVVSCKDDKVVCGCQLQAFGAHIANYPTPYMTVACAIGMEEAEITGFCKLFVKTMASFVKPKKPLSQPQPSQDSQQQ